MIIGTCWSECSTLLSYSLHVHIDMLCTFSMCNRKHLETRQEIERTIQRRHIEAIALCMCKFMYEHSWVGRERSQDCSK